MSRRMRDIAELVTIHRPFPPKRLPAALPEPARQPTGTELHNVRHRHLSQGLKAGWGFEKSARCAAEYMRARYGYVPITDQEGFYLCEIGLLDVNRGASQREDHPQTMPDVIRTRRDA